MDPSWQATTIEVASRFGLNHTPPRLDTNLDNFSSVIEMILLNPDVRGQPTAVAGFIIGT